MRLKEIKVKKLFGVFEHVIPLKMHDRITIIHGLNGYGKTTLLLLVQAVMQQQMGRLRRMPFAELILTFDNDTELRIHRDELMGDEPRSGKPVRLVIDLRQDGKQRFKHVVENADTSSKLGVPPAFIAQRIPDLEQIDAESWLDTTSGRILDLDEVLDVYGEFLPIPRRKPAQKLPEWLVEVTDSFDVRLIAAQRLLSLGAIRRARNSPSPVPFQPAVQIYSQELSGRIQKVQAEYGAKSQELDSSFAGRAIKNIPSPTIEASELEAKLRALEERRKGIITAGLLPADQNAVPIQGGQIEESVKGILALHASDVEQKLGVFDAIVAKLELLQELVNQRYSFKKLQIDQSGFRLISDSGSLLQPTDLSSGEQHELVLFYELLFRTEENALILIDEPELSLHVGWQSEFLKDLERVVRLSSLDVVLATHSPQIISNRWDLTVELQPPSA